MNNALKNAVMVISKELNVDKVLVMNALSVIEKESKKKSCMNCGTRMCDRGDAYRCGPESILWTPMET